MPMPSLARQPEIACQMVKERPAGKRILGSAGKSNKRRILPMQRDALALWAMHNGRGRDATAERTGLSSGRLRPSNKTIGTRNGSM
jgi:hypothetical protein